MTDSIKSASEGNGGHRGAKREASQATLSAIGDVSVAATEAVGRIAAAPRKTRWLPVCGFLLVVYIAASLVAIYTRQSPPWVQVFIAPLFLALIATLEFWRRQVWKFRAGDWRFKERAQREALNSLAHETANALNAVRANLAGFDAADSLPAATEHLKQVEQSLGRIDAALAKAVGESPPQPEAGSRLASASR
jgi:signal transduction histidine kinase